MSAKIEGTFGATGQSAVSEAQRNINISLQAFGSASINLEKSYNDGTDWEIIATYTANVSTTIFEPERHVDYRFNCTSYTSGAIRYRLGSDGV